MEQQVISIDVQDKPGVMTRISSLFSRRGFSVISLSVGQTHVSGVSRFTIVTEGDGKKMEQIRKQCQKIIHVLKTKQLFPKSSILREFAILKLKVESQSQHDLMHIVDFYGGRLLHSSGNQLILEFSGSDQKIDKIFTELKSFKILESIRTGKVGMKFE